MSLLGLLQTLIGRFVEKRARSFFITLFSVLNVYVLSLLIRELTYDHMGSGWVILSQFLFFAQGFLAATITIIITAFLLDQCGIRPYTQNAMFRTAVILYIVYAALLIANLFNKKIYYINDFNAYSRGEWFPVLIIPTIFIMIINLVILYQNRGVLSAWQMRAFFIYSMVPLISMVIQAFVFGVHFIAISSVISALFALTYIMYDQAERNYKMESENDKLKMDIMLAQIQPHFLFNSLITIKNLIRKDPIKAEKGITEFTDFLRHNMDSLTVDTPILFEEELTHVKEWYFTDGAHPGTTWIEVGDEVIPINPNAHSWGEWIVTKEPTDTEEGEEKHICKLCGAEETRAIPKVTPGTISYNVVEGSGQTWMKGSGSTADFVAKSSVYDQNTFKHFTGIRVDGNSVDRSYYTAESGSVIIKIKPEYLNTLSIGKHTLEIDFDDGKVSTEFYVAESKEGSGGGGGSDDSGVLAAVNPLANIMPFLPGMPYTGDSAGKSGSKFNGPNTGDESMIYTWLIIFVVSAGILVLALRPAIQTYLRRRKKTETK